MNAEKVRQELGEGGAMVEQEKMVEVLVEDYK